MTASDGTNELADALGNAFALMQARDYVGVAKIMGDAFDRVPIDELREAIRASLVDGFGYPVDAWIAVGDSVETADALYELAGTMWLMPHQEEESIKLLRQAISLGLEGDWADVVLVDMLLWSGRDEEAQAELTATLARGTEFAAELAGYQEVLNYQLHGRTDDDTVALLRRSLEFDDGCAWTLGRVLLDREEWDGARVVLEMVPDSDGGNPKMILGNLLLDQFHDAAAAEVAYRLGIELGDHFSAYNLAIMLFDLDNGRDGEAWDLVKYAAARGDSVAQRYLDDSRDRGDDDEDEGGGAITTPTRET